jgi:short-subunit dehydrogenase
VQTIYPGAIQTEMHSKSGAVKLQTKNFPSAEQVARKIVRAVATTKHEVTIGFANQLVRRAGYYFARVTDFIARTTS